ncbi:MAG TPA: hypothetical protein ENH53_02755 [Bacteroidetes bacterium]|nr:hypothetical protein [Bacteroidota bacterium]HDZ11106.1 hypothetical protein [Bacteroidota bacterium]
MLSRLLSLAQLNLKFVSFSKIQEIFTPEQILRGKILQQLQENLYVFRTKGMSLIAEATVPMTAGDIVTVKVLKKHARIELKLLEINDRPVRGESNIPVPNFSYSKIPVPQNFLGKGGFLEIYDFHKNNEEDAQAEEPGFTFQIVLETENSDFIILKAFRLNNIQQIKVYVTNTEFYKQLTAQSDFWYRWLEENSQIRTTVQIYHQEKWNLVRPVEEMHAEYGLNMVV